MIALWLAVGMAMADPWGPDPWAADGAWREAVDEQVLDEVQADTDVPAAEGVEDAYEPTPPAAEVPPVPVAPPVDQDAVDEDVEAAPVEAAPVEPVAPAAEPPSAPPAPRTASATRPGASSRLPWALLSWLLAVLALGVGLAATRARRPLRPRGLLPDALAVIAVGGRVVATGLGVLGLVVLTPPGYRSYLWLSVGLFVVVGVVLFFDALLDLAAGLILRVEGRVRPQRLLRMDGVEAVIVSLGWRATWVRGGLGELMGIPNRRLRGGGVVIEDARYPLAEVDVHLPRHLPPDLVREKLVDIGLLSPWRAPGARPEILRGDAPGVWRVEVRILDMRFATSHRETVLDLVRASLDLSGDDAEV